MKFSEMKYERPDEKDVLAKCASLEKQLQDARDYPQFLAAFKQYDQLLRHLATMSTMAEVHHTIDTRDAFWKEELDYFNEMNPVFEHAQSKVIAQVMSSPFRRDLENDVARTWFLTNENRMKTIDERIIEDIQQENRLASEYQNLVASAQIPFDGQVYTLASLEKKMHDLDEDTRRRAHQAYWSWFAQNEAQLGDIYDQLVKIRTRMAQKMGYENYVDFGYLRMNRMDYGRKEVEQYRRGILEDVVPVCSSLYKSQAARLHQQGALPVWNEKVEFEEGNPTPKYDVKTLVDHALKMYKELDGETGVYFQHLVDNDMMDLESKPGKAAGGYCTAFPEYGSPFIFANFNGTQGDAEVLTHEAGHGFQGWCSRDIFPMECVWPTMESAEIDSMSMEFFTWPWMELFFDDDADRYRYAHLAGAVKFLPYGVLVDHFQHEVYEHPQWTHEQRKACWRELEKQYLPHKNYEGFDFLEQGGWWMRQLHIFLDPFYYIDYTLAQVVALEFWKRMMDKDEKAFEDYRKICQAGGTKTFVELVEMAGVKNPFEPGCLKDTMEAVSAWYKDKDSQAR